jgi:hypothetical protein
MEQLQDETDSSFHSSSLASSFFADDVTAFPFEVFSRAHFHRIDHSCELSGFSVDLELRMSDNIEDKHTIFDLHE